MIDYNTQRSQVPENLLASNIQPPPPAVMAHVVSNHLKIAQSTSCDSTLAAKSRQELERFRGRPEVDEYFASKPIVG